MLKLNRKGYLTIEIILASAIAFVIAFFLIDITMKLVDKTDNYYVDTVFMTDKALVTKNLKELIESDINNYGIINTVDCPSDDISCKITFKDGTSKNLTINKNDENDENDKNDKKMAYEIKYGDYTKKFDTKLSGDISISTKLNKLEDRIYYVVFFIKFTNIFDKNNYDVIVPIKNIKKINTLANYITNLYNTADKTIVYNNNIEYNYATSVNLMNDRFGDVTFGLNDGSVRYYGSNPNNYIYFNCEKYPETNCELWRIIEVSDGKVKLIRNESIGSYSWDTSASTVNSGYGINEWSQADLMKLLNPGYESESVGGSLYYNSGSGTCYSGSSNATKSCNFTSTGLKNDTTRNMISDSTYYLGGGSSTKIYSNTALTMEIGTTVISNPGDGITRTTSWTGKIGLMYPSDYGYAADFTKCSQNLYNYDDPTCESYLSKILISLWLITPYFNNSTSSTSSAWGTIFSGVIADYTFNSYPVVPVLYLRKSVDRQGGSGTKEDPYTLQVN